MVTTPEDIVARVFGISAAEVTDQSSPHSIPAWDSLAHMTLVLELEREYTISVAPGDVIEMVNVRAIKEILDEYDVTW